MPGHSQIKPKQKPQKSIAVAMEEMKLAGEVPDDVGLLEGTDVEMERSTTRAKTADRYLRTTYLR